VPRSAIAFTSQTQFPSSSPVPVRLELQQRSLNPSMALTFPDYCINSSALQSVAFAIPVQSVVFLQLAYSAAEHTPTWLPPLTTLNHTSRQATANIHRIPPHSCARIPFQHLPVRAHASISSEAVRTTPAKLSWLRDCEDTYGEKRPDGTIPLWLAMR